MGSHNDPLASCQIRAALNESALPEIERGHTCDSAWLLHWQLLSHQYAQALMFDVLFPGTNANDSTQRAHL